jgi:hypothetical protein
VRLDAWSTTAGSGRRAAAARASAVTQRPADEPLEVVALAVRFGRSTYVKVEIGYAFAYFCFAGGSTMCISFDAAPS